MSTLDDISKEKQRINEALVRVDAQRERLSGQLSELEAAERVLGPNERAETDRRNDDRAGVRNRWFVDSSLEGDRFELPVPREIGSVSTLGEE